MPALARPASLSASTVIGSDGVVTATSNAFGTTLALDFTQHPADTSTAMWVTVNRMVAGAYIGRVRGLDVYPSIGGITVGYDHEPPLGVEVTYVATARNQAGTSTWTAAPVAVTIPANRNRAWLKCLATPARSVLLTGEAYPDWTRDITTGVFRPPGRRDPIVRQGLRQMATGTLTLHGLTGQEIVDLGALLLEPGPYLLQADDRNRVTRPDVYVAVQADQASQPYGDPEYRSWALPVIELPRPSTVGSRVSLPGHTFDDVAARYGAIDNYPKPLIRLLTD